MTTPNQRAVDLLIGVALLGSCAYAMYTGRSIGKFRVYTRSEEPWSFWAGVLIVFGIGVAFLMGYVTWHN